MTSHDERGWEHYIENPSLIEAEYAKLVASRSNEIAVN
jgi:hypothetical protein